MPVVSRPDLDLRPGHGGNLLQSLAADPRLEVYLRLADDATAPLVKHGRAHAELVAATAQAILAALGYPARLVELAGVAGLLHDIGNVIPRHGHAQSGALLALPVLAGGGLPAADIGTVLGAIGNHQTATGQPVSPVAAAVIIADKTDVRACRVRDGADVIRDVRNRVHAATRHTQLEVDPAGRTISFALDTGASLSDLHDVLDPALRVCGTAAERLGCAFTFTVNGQPLPPRNGQPSTPNRSVHV